MAISRARIIQRLIDTVIETCCGSNLSYNPSDDERDQQSSSHASESSTKINILNKTIEREKDKNAASREEIKRLEDSNATLTSENLEVNSSRTQKVNPGPKKQAKG